MDSVEWALLSSGLFAQVKPETFRALRQTVRSVQYAPGALIVQEGDVGDAMYVIESGAVQVLAKRGGSESIVLAKLEAGAHFGELALLPGRSGRRTASVRAHTQTKLLRIEREAFQRLLDEHDPLKEHLIELGTERLKENLARQSTLFQALAAGTDDDELREVTFAAGDVLFHEGDDGDTMYLLLSGRATVHRATEAGLARINTVEAGQCVGELALLRRAPRLATVIAETEVRALAVSGRLLEARLGTSPELRAYLQTVERVYALPRRGLVTQHAGTWMGRESLTTLYHLPRGRRVAATRVVGEDLFQLECGDGSSTAGSAQNAGHSVVLRYEKPDDDVLRELRLGPNGEILGVTARGYWAELSDLLDRAVDGVPLAPRPDPDEFSRSGTLAARAEPATDERRICSCVQVTRGAIAELVREGVHGLAEVQARTRCGTVCGACVPWVLELLGHGEWTPVRIVEEIPVAEGIRSFRLAPRDGKVEPFQPGQHVIVEAGIDGLRVQRAYTLTSPSQASEHYEITVKREPRGTFSRWLFDRLDAEPKLRVSRPRGKCTWDATSERTLVCLVAGIGVTPALAALRSRSNGASRRLHVDYSAHSRAELAYAREFEDAVRSGAGVSLTLRETRKSGRLDADLVRALVTDHPDADYLVCGPEGYLRAVVSALENAGIPRERLLVETFTHAGDPPRSARRGTEGTTATALATAAGDGAPDGAFPIAAGALRTDRPTAWSDLWSPPVAPAKHGLIAALRAFGSAVSWFVNHPIWEWRIGGVQLNPLRWLADKVAERAAKIDRTLPREYLSAVGTLSLGPARHHAGVFRRLERQRHPAPDTYAQIVPNPPLAQYSGPLAVDTGWTKVFDGVFLPMIVTRSRSVLREVLCHPERFDRGPLPYHHLQQVVGSPDVTPTLASKAAGLFAGQLHDNATWQRDRKLGVETFGGTMLDPLAGVMTSALNEISRELDPLVARADIVVDAGAMFLRIAFQMVVRSTFGDLDPERMTRIGSELRPLIVGALAYVSRATYGLHGDRPLFEKQMTRAHELVGQIVDLVRAAHAEGRLDSARRFPVVDLIVQGTERGPLSVAELFPFLAVALVAGHETTGHTIAWAVYELCRDPELMADVRAEIDRFYAEAPDRVLTSADYTERPWTQALLFELGRVHPPVYAIPRTALADGSMAPDPSTGLGGFGFCKGTTFVVSFLGVHRDPARWPDAERFFPRRFMEGAPAGATPQELGRHVFAAARAREGAFDLVTFSAGPGRCLGQEFNMLEFFLVLDALLRRYDLELVDPDAPVRDSDAEISGPEAGSLIVRIRKRALSAA